MADVAARVAAQGASAVPPARATFLTAPGVPYCGLGQVPQCERTQAIHQPQSHAYYLEPSLESVWFPGRGR
jgi:hypothetical protein